MKNQPSQNSHDIGNLRDSHMPLFLMNKPLKRLFLENLQENPTELTEEEIRTGCFKILGYLEEFSKTKVNKNTGKDIQRKKAIEDLENPEDLFEFLVRDGQDFDEGKDLQEEKMPDPNDIQEKSDGEEENKEPNKSPEKQKPLTSIEVQRDYLTQKIRELFSYSQVREFFLETLKKEAKQYREVRPTLETVSRMKFAQDGAFRKMIEIYLQSKRKYKKLMETDAQNIQKLEKMRQKAQEIEEGIFSSADETTRGFLKAQELLQYKKQIRQRGFALTPSRKKMISKITDHVLAGRKVFLVGSTGTGKTELAMYVADEVSGKYEVVSWHEGTTPRDLFGYRELITTENGHVISGTKPGPVTKAALHGATAIHDEYSAGTVRTQLAAKAFMNAEPGEKIHIPGFNGEVFEVSDTFAEIFTGNLKDERTKAREEMDPAILRMLTGLKIDYMPASEMRDIILANIIEDNGILKLSVEEVELISKLCKAAELMQMFHDREFSSIEKDLGADSVELLALKRIFGGELHDAKLDKNFLDPGTLFSLFSDFDFTRAKQGNLKSHLEKRIEDFLHDPKNENAPEERKLLRRILEIQGVIQENKAIVEVKLEEKKDRKDYLLPSELAILSGQKLSDISPLDPGDIELEITKKTETEMNLEGLDSLGHIHYLGIDTMNEALKSLKSQRVEIPEDEMQRLRSLLPQRLTPEHLLKFKKLKEVTEEDTNPIVMQLPEIIMINGERQPFTIALMDQIMKAEKDGGFPCTLFLSDDVSSQIKNQPWSSNLRAWTSACLKDSKSKSYDDQVIHQRSMLLGFDGEIGAEMILVMTLHYLARGKSLMEQDYMHLNKGASAVPLSVRSFVDDLLLDRSVGLPDPGGGFGASLEIS